MRDETITKNLKEIMKEDTYNKLMNNTKAKNDKDVLKALKKVYPNAYESLLEDIEDHIKDKRVKSRQFNKH